MDSCSPVSHHTLCKRIRSRWPNPTVPRHPVKPCHGLPVPRLVTEIICFTTGMGQPADSTSRRAIAPSRFCPSGQQISIIERQYVWGMWHPAATLLGWIGLPLARWFWTESKDILDWKLIEAPITLNRRKGSNAGRGRGFRSHSDPSPGQFRKYDNVMPHFIN